MSYRHRKIFFVHKWFPSCQSAVLKLAGTNPIKLLGEVLTIELSHHFMRSLSYNTHPDVPCLNPGFCTCCTWHNFRGFREFLQTNTGIDHSSPISSPYLFINGRVPSHCILRNVCAIGLWVITNVSEDRENPENLISYVLTHNTYATSSIRNC